MSKIPALVVLSAALVTGSACRKAATPAENSTAAAAASGSTAAPAPAPTPCAGRIADAAAKPPAPPAAPVPAKLPDVLARVNGEDVTKTDFDLLLRNVVASNGPVPADRRDEILRRVLDELVTYTVLKQEAKARKVTADGRRGRRADRA